MSNPKPLEVSYDFVAIIDMLPANERQTWQISDELKGLIEGFNLSCDRVNCSSKAEVVTALQRFCECARDGKKFCLHFVSHGSAAGLCVKATDESIQWCEFRSILKAINMAMDEKLILNMTTCEGLHGIKIVDPADKDMPFFGLIGVNRLLLPDEAVRLNEQFYSMMSAGKQIQTIIQEIAQAPGGEVLDCISSAGFKANSQKG